MVALVELAIGRMGIAELADDAALLGIVEEAGRDGGIDPHAAFAAGEQSEVLVVAVGGGTGRAVFLQEVDIDGQAFLPGRCVELRLPFHVEPACAIGIGDGGDLADILAPAGFAAQADAVDPVIGIVDLGGKAVDVLPGRLLGHGQAGLVEQILAIEGHLAFGVERQGVELAVVGKPVPHRFEHVVELVVCGHGIERRQPVALAPHRRFEQADGHDIILAALGGDVGGQALAQGVFLQHHPVQLDVRVLGFEILRQLLHHHHVVVVDGGDGQLGFGLCRQTGDERRCRAEAQRLESSHGFLLLLVSCSTSRCTAKSIAGPAPVRRQASSRRGIGEMRKLHPSLGKASEFWQRLLAN